MRFMLLSIESRLPIIENFFVEVQPMPLPVRQLFDLDELYKKAADEIAETVDRELSKGYRMTPMTAFFLNAGTSQDRFPHDCPRCGGPAYIGLNDVDCMHGCP